MFGRRKKNDAGSASAPGAEPFVDGIEDEDDEVDTDAATEGPHDLADLDEDRETIAQTRLDLGSVLIPLHDQLRDAIAALEDDRSVQIVVDQTHLDLPAVAGVDGARGVDHRQSRFRGQARTWVYQADGPQRQSERDTGPHQDAFARSNRDRGRDPQIDSRVSFMCSSRHR